MHAQIEEEEPRAAGLVTGVARLGQSGTTWSSSGGQDEILGKLAAAGLVAAIARLG